MTDHENDRPLNEIIGNIGAHDPVFVPRFDLDTEELRAVELEMSDNARELFGDTVSIAWVSADHPFSNFFRTHESRYFPEVEETDPEYDVNQVYLAVVDTRDGRSEVVHGASLMGFREVLDADGEVDQSKTGLYTVDSLIEYGNFSRSEFEAYYSGVGIDFSQSIGIETNFRTSEKFERFFGMKSSDLAYLTVVNSLIAGNAPIGKTLVFATINQMQIDSLSRVGVDIEPLMGRDDFRTEEAELGGYSMPAVVLINDRCVEIFGSKELSLPSVVY